MRRRGTRNNILSSSETSWGSTIGKLKKINGSVNKKIFCLYLPIEFVIENLCQ
jgi:uncharacterized membrane protein